jgi:putative thioredoxin
MSSPSAPAGALVKDATDQSFRADVLEESLKQPVLVDFWAPWCGPCRTLGPMIERAVAAAGGRVKLVKINIDENPQFARQLRVQSIPAVFAFDKGQPVDGFMGALPESQIKQFIDRIAGEPAPAADVAELIAQAEESMALGDIGGAAQGYAEAVQMDPENVKAIAGLARCYLAGGEPEQARQVLAMVPKDKAGDPAVAAVEAALSLAEDGGGDVAALRKALQADPADHQARFDLAGALAAQGDLQEAVDHLLDIVEADREWNDQAARKQALKIFEAAGLGSDLSKNGRRRLSTILFS